MGKGEMMKVVKNNAPTPTIQNSYFWRKFPEICQENDFKTEKIIDEDTYFVDIISTNNALVAYVFLEQMGENFFVAKKGVPIEPRSIVHAKDGWRWIGDVVPDFFDAYEKKQSESFDGLTVAPEIKIALYAAKLREFLLMSEADW